MYKFTLLVTTPRPHRALPVVVVVAAARVHGVPHPARRQPVQRRGQRGDLDRDKQNAKYILITHNSCLLCLRDLARATRPQHLDLVHHVMEAGGGVEVLASDHHEHVVAAAGAV